MSTADELLKLAQLRDQGVLTETEFAAQKNRLLGQSVVPPSPAGAAQIHSAPANYPQPPPTPGSSWTPNPLGGYPTSSTPAWRGPLRVLLIVVSIAVAGLVVGHLISGSPSLDPNTIIPTMQGSLSQQVGDQVTVTCPSAPLKANYIFDCTATDSTGSLIVRVTENDNQGHVTWQLTSQRANGPDGRTG